MSMFLLLSALASTPAIAELACALRDHQFEGESLYINVLEYAKAGALKRSCYRPDCQKTDVFGTIDAEACSIVCSMAPQCVAWSYEDKEYDGVCRIFAKNEKTHKKAGFISGVRECHMSPWPECLHKDVAYENYDRGEALWFDATAYGSHATEGCSSGDCMYTDKMVVTSVAACGSLCSKVPDCKYWTYGEEESLTKCWLRLTDESKSKAVGKISGSATCGSYAPVIPSAWTDGENKCWSAGFTADLCCDQRFGPQGKAECWDASFTFNMCCLGQKPAWVLESEEA